MNLTYLIYGMALSFSCFTFILAEPVCHKCEIVRDYNKKHPGEYEYYDDYLKNHEENVNPSLEKPSHEGFQEGTSNKK